MNYLKQTFTIMLIGIALFFSAALIAASYTVRVILDTKKKW